MMDMFCHTERKEGLMEIKTDIHCHTIASDHAYSTLLELAKAASDKGLEAIAVTDHCPALGDAPHPWHFECLKGLPDQICGVRVLSGCEVNIIDKEGHLDLEERVLAMLDIVVASVHNPVYQQLDLPDNTQTYLNVLENPYVDILGHSGNPRCRYEIETVLNRAKEMHKFIEINNNTFNTRPDNVEICREIAKRAKELGVGVVVNSDAHFCLDIGSFDHAIKMLREIEFPEELIINRNLNSLKQALKPRKEI